MDFMILGADPSIPGIDELKANVRRSMEAASATNQKDRDARERKRLLFEEMKAYFRDNAPPPESVLEGLGRGQEIGDRDAVGIPAGHVDMFVEKLVRSLLYKKRRVYLTPPYYVRFLPVDEEQMVAGGLRALLDRGGYLLDLLPAIKIRFALRSDEPRVGFYEFWLWGQIPLRAITDLADPPPQADRIAVES